MVKITSVTPHSRAERHGISAGDILVSINGREVTDVLDYRFFLTATEVKLSLTRGSEPFDIHRGDRIAQMMFMPVLHASFLETDTLDQTDRGTGGFGHTGVK